jgi:hypothetical protein
MIDDDPYLAPAYQRQHLTCHGPITAHAFSGFRLSASQLKEQTLKATPYIYSKNEHHTSESAI